MEFTVWKSWKETLSRRKSHCRGKCRILSISRGKSHFSGSWLLIRNRSSGLLNNSWKLERRLRMSSRRVRSSNDRFRLAARTWLSIFVQTTKISFLSPLTFLTSSKVSITSRQEVKNKKASKFSTSEYVRPPISIQGKIQNAFLGSSGWRYFSGRLVALQMPTGAAPKSWSPSLKNECVWKGIFKKHDKLSTAHECSTRLV